jgi:hypothetical protein
MTAIRVSQPGGVGYWEGFSFYVDFQDGHRAQRGQVEVAFDRTGQRRWQAAWFDSGPAGVIGLFDTFDEAKEAVAVAYIDRQLQQPEHNGVFLDDASDYLLDRIAGERGGFTRKPGETDDALRARIRKQAP